MGRRKKQKSDDRLWDETNNCLPIEPESEEETATPAKEYTKRYIASLQKENDPYCFKNFADSSNLDELKTRCEKKVKSLLAKNKNLGVIIYDTSNNYFVSYRYNLPALPQVEESKGKKVIVNDVSTRLLEWIKNS